STLDPKKASLYTGGAYIITVLFLIFPYMLSQDVYLSLGWMIINAVIVIFLFTFYTAVAKDLSFKKRFLEMTSISLGIAILTFVIGFLIRTYFGVEI
ncbi:MAG: rubrerythrin family protein, partial [Thermoplasmatota archaeon]